MKKHLILFISLVCVVSLYAQDSLLVIGKKIDGTELKAAGYLFSDRIQTFSVDPSMEYLCLNFRETTKNGKYLKNKGEIGLYHIADKTLLWKAPIDYGTTRASCVKQGILLTSLQRISMLDKTDGFELWNNSFYPVYKDDSLNVMLGYNSVNSGKLRAVKLDDGVQLWETKLPHEHGWDEIYPLEGSEHLVVADGIHKLDLLTGANTYYKLKTGVTDVKAALLQGLGSIALGVATGITTGGAAYYVPTASNVITGLVSNVWMQDSCYYVADRERVLCLDEMMTSVWEYELPNKKASKSTLFAQSDCLYMLNYGYGVKDGRYKKNTGRPFIAGFDRTSGKPKFFNQLSVKKDRIEDALLGPDGIYMLFDDGLSFQAYTDSIVNITPWETDEYGKLQGLLADTLYVFQPGTNGFIPIAFDGVDCPVYTDKGRIFIVDKDLRIKTEHNEEHIYFPCIELKDYICVNRGNDFWFLHRMGMPIAHFNLDIRKGATIGNKVLLLTEENRLLYLDLDEVVK